MKSDVSACSVSTPSALIDVDRLAAGLGSKASRLDLVAIAECASTNTLLIDGLPQEIAPRVFDPQRGVLLVADRQTAGRGRRGRSWIASPDDSLTFSLRWNFPRKQDLSGLSLAVGLSLRRGLLAQGYTGIVLKWPNDLLVNSAGRFAKLGGILIELASADRHTGAVIGVGINLRAPQPPVPDQLTAGLDAVSADPAPIDRHLLLSALLTNLVETLDRFSAEGFTFFQSAWNEADGFSGRTVMLTDEGRVVHQGTCLGVDVDGALRVATANGVVRWLAGDVSLRLQESDER